ncbi:M48 family metallopeptidase [Marinicella sediminis]|uniref:M48 family metallopeptidase n=1 Tax=Marinicella sediminis TaxID=1792834 RepID=A0ABV7JF58_9GAMM|nr:M48 family metallopeptidase [Marinicella sediminis]
MRTTGIILIILTLASCATSPTGRKQLILVGDQQMNQMGVTSFQELKKAQKVAGDRRQQSYVGCVSFAIINALPDQGQDNNWEVVVFEDDSANAFALPGGKIGVHTGLLDVATTPSQLATVLGHEVAHVLSRHGAERVSIQMAAQTGLQVADMLSNQHVEGSRERQIAMAVLGLGTQVGVLLPFSRTHEKEADQLGLNLMAAAGFDPTESVQLWRNMDAASGGQRPPEFLSTHPEPENRIIKLNEIMQQAIGIQQQALANGVNPRCRR